MASLPGTGDQELLYLRTSDNTLWRDKDGAGGWEEIGGSTAGPEFPDDTFRVYDNADNTKKLAFEVSGVTTGTTRTFTVPDENGWIGLFRLNGSSVLINTLGRVLDLPANVGGGWAMRTWESGDASQRFAITSSGLLQWNDGAGGGFVHLFRGATGRLDMDDGEWLRLREYLEQEEITTPANPDTGYVRTYAKAGPVAGSRHYLKDDDGNEHDLSVAHKQTFWCAQDDDESSEINVPWGYTNYPSGASIATVTPASQVAITYAMGVGAALLPDAYAHFEWASVAIPSFGVTDGSQVVLAVPVRKHGDTVTVRARVRVNNVQYLDKVYFSVNDSASTSGGSINVLGSMSNNTWYEAVLADVDVSSLTDFMRIVVTAQGTTNDAAGFSGATEFDVEYITIEQWFK
ncbi:hypothetical protein IIA79_01370 [bacterium]|nr:hypothetical protein [bacterium]